MHVSRLGAVVALGLLALAAAAAAAPATGGSKPTALAQPAPPALALLGKQPGLAPQASLGAPRGYRIVSTARLTALALSQAHASISCPAGKMPLGGGVYVSSPSTSADVNDSYPSGSSWVADVNNGSGADTTFTVEAICAKVNSNYDVAITPGVDNPPFSQGVGFAQCPAHTRQLGGGLLSTSGTLDVNLNSDYPYTSRGKRYWYADENNAGDTSPFFNVYAVCGSAAGLTTAVSGEIANPAGMQTFGFAQCPAPTVPIGGGVLSESVSTAENVNVSAAATGGWEVYMNNATASSSYFFKVYAICAGT
jgi:hypothetical protein